MERGEFHGRTSEAGPRAPDLPHFRLHGDGTVPGLSGPDRRLQDRRRDSFPVLTLQP